MKRCRHSEGARRAQVAHACMACRSSKVKCSGKHPACSRCQTRGIECQYDVSEEGMTKRQHLHHELFEQKQALLQATAILSVLRYGSDKEATTTLARLRLGKSLADECSLLETTYHTRHRQLRQRPRPRQSQNQQQQREALSTPINPLRSSPSFPEAASSLLVGHCPTSPHYDTDRFRPTAWLHPQTGLDDNADTRGEAWETAIFHDGDSQPMSSNQAISPLDLHNLQPWMHGYASTLENNVFLG